MKGDKIQGKPFIKLFALFRAAECGLASTSSNRESVKNAYRSYKNGCYHMQLSSVFLELARSKKIFSDFIEQNFKTEFFTTDDITAKDKATILLAPFFSKYKVLNIGPFIKLLQEVSYVFKKTWGGEDERARVNTLSMELSKRFLSLCLKEIEKAHSAFWDEFKFVRDAYITCQDKYYLWDSFENNIEHDEIAKHIIARGYMSQSPDSMKAYDELINKNNGDSLKLFQTVDKRLPELLFANSTSHGSQIDSLINDSEELLLNYQRIKKQKFSFIVYNEKKLGTYEKLYKHRMNIRMLSVFNAPTEGNYTDETTKLIADLIHQLSTRSFPFPYASSGNDSDNLGMNPTEVSDYDLTQ